MDENTMIDNLIRLLDQGTLDGVGHVNVAYTDSSSEAVTVDTLRCPDSSMNPMACQVPTLHEGLDRE